LQNFGFDLLEQSDKKPMGNVLFIMSFKLILPTSSNRELGYSTQLAREESTAVNHELTTTTVQASQQSICESALIKLDKRAKESGGSGGG
jgi:hypothetical protein